MKKKSLVTAFSFSADTADILNNLKTKTQKSRSQLLREMINYYAASLKSGKEKSFQPVSQPSSVQPDDAGKILKYYFELISSQKPYPTLVIAIAVISKKNTVLIGERKFKDTFVKNLTWTFPTSKLSTLNFTAELIKSVQQETGFFVKVNRFIHARFIPDVGKTKLHIVALYYHCKIISGHARPGGDFKSLKWVKAAEVHRHFTTSVCDEITTFLHSL